MVRQHLDPDTWQYLGRLGLSDKVWRRAIALFTLAFGGLSVLMMFADGGAGNDLWRKVVMALAALSTLPVAWMLLSAPLGQAWWSKRSDRGFNTGFVVYADLGVVCVLAAMREPLLSVLGCGLFTVIGAYVSHFVSQRALIGHVVFTSAVIVAFGVRMIAHGFPVIEGLAILIGALLVANGVVGLLRRYTVELQKSLRVHLTESSTDPLTLVLNRRGFSFRAGLLVRSAPQRLAVASVDIDDFKSINDRLGHAVGDRVLRDLAVALRSGMSEGAVVARMGGDEFAIAATATKKELEYLVEGLHENPVLLPDGSPVTVSVGVVLASRAGILTSSPKPLVGELYDIADAALQESKNRGRVCTTLWRLDDKLDRLMHAD